MSDRITDAMQAIGAILRLLSPADRRIVVQATYNVAFEQFGGDQLLRLGNSELLSTRTARPTPQREVA
jgi:hypothetical protein